MKIPLVCNFCKYCEKGLSDQGLKINTEEKSQKRIQFVYFFSEYFQNIVPEFSKIVPNHGLNLVKIDKCKLM